MGLTKGMEEGSRALWTGAVVVCVAALVIAGCEGEKETAVESPLGLDREQLWSFITTGDPDSGQAPGVLPAEPFYEHWPLYPGPPGDPEEFLDKRLSLATHGRWATVRVNPVASRYLTSYLDKVDHGGGDIPPAELPVGSIVLKINYPNVNRPEVIRRANLPAVLTLFYKPGGGICESGFRYNGTDCLGGGWRWVFYGIDDPKGNFDREIFDKFVGENSQAFCINCHDPAFHEDYLRALERLARTSAAEQRPTRDPRRPPEIPDDDPFCRSPRLSFVLPADVSLDPASLPRPDRQRLFDCFSWRAFVALSWPADKDVRGKADTSAAFGDFSGDRETVWETYKATYEVFQPDDVGWDPEAPGNPAGNFNSKRPIPPACPADSGLPVFSIVAKSNSRFPDGQDVANEAGQAFAGQFGTLTDRNGRFARYQVLFNETEFDFLVPTAATAKLTPNGPGGGQGVFLPDGSIEVKAAWKELCTAEQVLAGECEIEDAVDTFYHRDALVYDADTDTCERMPLGLIGLHVAVKTFWAPQWIWATFEHVSNVPPAGRTSDNGEGYSFFDPACRPQPGKFRFVACSAQPFLAPAVENTGDPCCPNVSINRWPEVGFGARPNQLTRLVPVAGSGLNPVFQGLMAKKNPVFGNYLLVNTQWPLHGRRPAAADGTLAVNTRLCESQRSSITNPFGGDDGSQADPGCYTMVPEFLRNSVIESYMSGYFENPAGEVVQVSNRSCMGCHKSGTDFSYLWIDAVEQRVPIASKP